MHNYGHLVMDDINNTSIPGTHYHIIAYNNQGQRFVFGTSATMLMNHDDAERFKTCDLDRYPCGDMLNNNNRVFVVENLDGLSPYKRDNKTHLMCRGCDETYRLFESKNTRSIKVIREL